MTFEKALEAVYDKDIKEKGKQFADNNRINNIDELKIAAKIWNALALAQKEKGLDDFIIINNGNIISLPLKEKKKDDNDETKIKTKGKGKSPKKETAKEKAVNVKEESEKEPTEKQPDSE